MSKENQKTMTTKTINIYTADQKRRKIAEIVSQYFDGFTIYPNLVGGWRDPETGKLIIEKALKIEIIDPPLFNNNEPIKRLCNDIKILNNQSAVLVAEILADGSIATKTL